MNVGSKRRAGAEDAARRSDAPQYLPAADIYDSPGAVTVLLDMAGVRKDSVAVTADGESLTVSGAFRPGPEADADALYVECAPGDFFRTFVLTPEVDASGMEASMADGVLRIVIPKVPLSTRRVRVR